MGETVSSITVDQQKQAANKRIKIAYYCVNDPLDKRSWSGITYYLGQSLQRNVGDVDFLGPLKPSRWVDKALRAIAKLIRITTGKEYNVKHSLLLSWDYNRQMKRRMKGREYDCIVAPAASTELALFRSQIPVVYVSDTTFQLISNFYTWDFEKMPAISRWEGNTIERLALQHSTGVVLSSNWATNSAIHDYGVPAEKILTIPLGANVDFVPEADVIFQKLQGQELTLLYLAVEWERKGGPLAFETLQQLHAKGVKAKLIICGCIPPSQFQHPYMEVIPFLNKNKKEDHDKFVELLSTVHFLLLPTRADCSLLVSCEASAYGVPVISTRTGGVNEVVLDDVNGYCLPHEAKGEAYAEVILKIYSDRARYEKLIHSSRKRYENHLNWDQWAKDFIRFYESKFTRTQS